MRRYDGLLQHGSYVVNAGYLAPKQGPGFVGAVQKGQAARMRCLGLGLGFGSVPP